MSADVETALAHHNMMPESNVNLMTCKVYGCKRTYKDMEALNRHLNDHLVPVESLPGKVFLCSSGGCEGSFSSMQELMEHMRVHYKPNVYFICEGCRSKLRSYRTLLKHLQTCAKVAKSKAAAARTEAHSEPLAELGPPTLTPAVAAAPGPDAAEMSEPEHMETEAAETVPMATASTSAPPSASEAAAPPTAMEQSDPELPVLSFSPGEAPAPSPGMPQSPPSQPPLSSTSPPSAAASTATWRKNQGQSFSSRILWEHTRGRYNCLQCGHSTPNRKEMTAHIDGLHKSPPGKSPSESGDGTESSPTQLQSPSDCEASADTQP